MYKVHMHAGAIRKLLYGVCILTVDNSLAKARGLLPVYTHKQYSNLHMNHCRIKDYEHLILQYKIGQCTFLHKI